MIGIISSIDDPDFQQKKVRKNCGLFFQIQCNTSSSLLEISKVVIEIIKGRSSLITRLVCFIIQVTNHSSTQLLPYLRYNFSMNPHVHLLVGRSVGWSVCPNFLKEWAGSDTSMLLSDFIFDNTLFEYKRLSSRVN